MEVEEMGGYTSWSGRLDLFTARSAARTVISLFPI